MRYFVTAKSDPQPEMTYKTTYSLVGTSTENGGVCRWVEIQTTETRDGREVTDILKFLVPEKDLLEAERPLESLVRSWRRFHNGHVEEMKFNVALGERGLVGSADFYWGRDFALFPGPQKEGEVIRERRKIEYQRGRVEIDAGKAFRRVASRRALTTGEKQEWTDEFTVWNHPELAPAFGAARARVEYRRDEALIASGRSEFVLEEFGTDAKSALPDNN